MTRVCGLLLQGIGDAFGQVGDVVQVNVVAAVIFQHFGALGSIERVELKNLDAATKAAEYCSHDHGTIGARVVMDGYGVAFKAAAGTCNQRKSIEHIPQQGQKRSGRGLTRHKRLGLYVQCTDEPSGCGSGVGSECCIRNLTKEQVYYTAVCGGYAAAGTESQVALGESCCSLAASKMRQDESA
jgi:hypothetical protein